jgi:hypothetical protein
LACHIIGNLAGLIFDKSTFPFLKRNDWIGEYTGIIFTKLLFDTWHAVQEILLSIFSKKYFLRKALKIKSPSHWSI